MSAESRFAANSKLSFVLVEFSKNAKTMVFPRRVGTFFMFRLLTSRNDVAVWRIFSTFSGDNGRTDSKSFMFLMFFEMKIKSRLSYHSKESFSILIFGNFVFFMTFFRYGIAISEPIFLCVSFFYRDTIVVLFILIFEILENMEKEEKAR